MKAFIIELKEILNYNNPELIEIDLILHKILSEFAKNQFLRENLLFKGGTCLIKTYFDYYRFSQDLDFTWKDQKCFENKGSKTLKRELSKKITEILIIIENISKKLDLDFKTERGNQRYILYGENKKNITTNIYYKSEFLEKEGYIKVQINFCECLKFKSKTKSLSNIIPKSEELKFLFPQEVETFSENFKLQIYDHREILCEKIRAILTRIGVKEKDYIDIYKIIKKFNLNLKDYEDEIVDKIIYVLELYKKYRENYDKKVTFLLNEKSLSVNSLGDYMLKTINDEDFNIFLKPLHVFLKKIISLVDKKSKKTKNQ